MKGILGDANAIGQIEALVHQMPAGNPPCQGLRASDYEPILIGRVFSKWILQTFN